MEYEFGRASETQLSTLMMTKFGVTQSLDKYAHFDYESEDTLVELKTRRILSTSFPDYMMNGCKLRAAAASGKKVYFVYRFLDGIFYWQFDPTVTTRIDYNGRKDRGRDETQLMHYLPSSVFRPLE